MTTTAIMFVIVIAVIAFIVIIKNNQPKNIEGKDNNRTPIKSSYLMTEHEKTMFKELRQAIPEYYIFPQVSLGAILWTKGQATRNKFNRKIADYVITDQNFNILAVIELDDKSHQGKEQQDAERDSMLKEAGYKVLRYPNMPSKEKLRNDILN